MKPEVSDPLSAEPEVVIEAPAARPDVRRAADMLRLILALAVVLVGLLVATLADDGVQRTERGVLETIVTVSASLRDALTAAAQLVAVILPAAILVALAVRRRFAAVGKVVVAGVVGVLAGVVVSHLLLGDSHPPTWHDLLTGRNGIVDPDLDKYRKMDPRAIVNAAVDTIAGGVPDEIRADYLACYDGDRFVESMRYVRRYPEELPALAELLPHIATQVTLINGRHDRVVPLANAEFLHARLTTSRLVIIDAGHFVWEEAPKEYASIILESITGSS
jgi:pimeloyl-ACP methyl ester carboxylesterase